MRILPILELLPAALCLFAAGTIYRQSLSPSGTGWRRHVAASIPAIHTLLLLLIWVLPLQLFLVSTLDARSWLPILLLTFLGAMLAVWLPSGYFQLRQWEGDGRIYAALGVRRFRNLVTYGDPMVRLMRRIDPESRPRLKSSTLAERERRTRRTEKIHWGMLLGSVPAAVWAIVVREPWFPLYLLAANVPMNIYPIMLQRYTRARLLRMEENIRIR